VIVLFVMMQVTIGTQSGAMCQPGAVDLEQEAWVIDDPTHLDFGTRSEATQLQVPTSPTSDCSLTKQIAYVEGFEVFVSLEANEKDARLVRMSCYVSLQTFMTGFAAISAGGSLQQHGFFAQSPATAALPVLVVKAFLFVIFQTSSLLRARMRQKEACDLEGPQALWEVETTHAESNIMSLSTSFVTVQVLRFWISGVLPDRSGLEQPERPHSLNCVILLYVAGVSGGFASFMIQNHLLRRMGDRSSWLARASHTFQSTCSMICAWCMIFGTRWAAMRTEKLHEWGINPGTMAWQLVLATGATLTTFVFIFVLRRVEQCAPQDVEVSSMLRSFVTTLGLLVGFTWQRSFELGVKTACSAFARPAVWEVVVSLAVAMIVVPAWRKYILTKVYRRHKMHVAQTQEALAVEQEAPSDQAQPIESRSMSQMGLMKPQSSKASLECEVMPLVTDM